jgi:HlyD family secretion protein
MKKFLFFFVFVLLLICLYVFNSNGSEESLKPIFKTSKVLQGDLSVKISATGIVEPNSKVEVKSKASGEVLSFPFEEGAHVKKGTLLLKLDKSDEQRNVAKARTELSSSSAKYKKAVTSLLLQKTKYNNDIKSSQSGIEAALVNLQEAEDKLKRQSELFKKRFISQESLDAASSLFKVNKEKLIQAQTRHQTAIDSFHDITMKENEIELVLTEVKRSEISLEEVSERLDETEIFAPINGVIIEKLVEEGQIIASGISNVNGGTAIATIADMSRLFIIADIDETDIGSVKIGHIVKITSDAFPEKTFGGKVTRIAPQGLIENSITIFKVKIEIQGPDKNLLKPMMSANIDIVTHMVNDTLYVSRAGIRQDEKSKFTMLLKNDHPEKVRVETGIRNPIHIQILSGLNPEEEIILGDWEKVLEASKEKKTSSLKKILWMIRSK